MPETIADLFYSSIKHDLPVALSSRIGGAFRGISHREVQARVERLALALAARGLDRGDRLAILSENRPEWAVTDFACALSGIVTVPVYPTLNPPQTAYILQHCQARWVVVLHPGAAGQGPGRAGTGCPTWRRPVLVGGRRARRRRAAPSWPGTPSRTKAPARKPAARKCGSGPGASPPATC